MIIKELAEKGLAFPPSWLPDNTPYMVVMGSMAYGTSIDASDFDIYGCAIPPKSLMFPHLTGAIPQFGPTPTQFEQWQKHHIFDPDALGGKGREYDFTIYNIAKYFHLCMGNNPNCIDSLFVPHECVLCCTHVGNLIRENRKLFLSKKCYATFKGYAFKQIHKMETKETEGKRKELRDKYGYDVKYAMHLVRLLDECQQILTNGDIDLRQNNEHHKAIRRGEVKKEDVLKWASDKEHHLEELYVKCTLPEKPNYVAIKELLLNCLEHHYGSLKDAVVVLDRHQEALKSIRTILDANGVY